MAGLKYSRQREAVLDYLRSTTSHPTAEEIYSVIRQEFPKVSLGTIYRNLNLLTEQGQIARLTCGDNVEHFDAVVETHNHFICQQCGRIQDLDYHSETGIDRDAQKVCSGRIKGHHLYFYGTCNQCLSKHA